MHTEEQQLIDGLFSRLRDAERQGGSRDAQAEQLIQQRLRDQPAAPYYMAQVVLIQEAALKRLEQRVKDLETQVSQLQTTSTQNRPSSGSFLSGLFGGSQSTPAVASAPPAPVAPSSSRGWVDSGYRSPTSAWGQGSANAAPQPQHSGGGFMAGAAQTALGVAGGMLLAETLSGFFHDKPETEAAASAVDSHAAASAATTAATVPEAVPFQSADAYQSVDYDLDDEGGDFLSDDDETFV